MTVVCNALGRCAGHSISLLTFDRLPFFKPFQTTRQRRNLNPTAVPAFNSAAYWRGQPSDDACEIASDFNREGEDSVTARIRIHASVQQVWNVLMDFENLVDIVPNLIECQEIPSPDPKLRRLRQSAGLKCKWWKLHAKAVLEIQTQSDSPQRKELQFRMIEGDFKEYRGRFLIEADPNGWASILVFDVFIEPLESIPRRLFLHAVQIWLPFNLDGIVKHAEQIALKEMSVSPFAEPSLESEIPIGQPKRPLRKRANPATYLGTAFVPLPSSAPEFLPDITLTREKEATLPAFDLDSMELEGVAVHLRKLDTKEYLHRRVVCTILIEAPPRSVWNILTDYDRLAEFVPNLAESAKLPCPPGAPAGYHRIRQVVQKFQTYIQLRAESVMDVVERPLSEIQFRQVHGFVEHLQGKWILKAKPNEWSSEDSDTLLTYALEIKTPRSDTPFDLIEPIFERAAVEGLPLNLTAIKQEVQRLFSRPSLSRLCNDFEILREELIRCYPKNNNVLPSRTRLRKDRRTDLEKAMTAHGGPAMVSERMGWNLPNKRRKRRGYWDDFDNLKQELKEFIGEKKWKRGERLLSKADFNEAGRVDLRRAVEKWGGLQSVMELIDLEEEPVQGNATPIRGRSRKMNIDLKDVDRL